MKASKRVEALRTAKTNDMKTNHYNIYREENRANGNVAVQYTAIAESEEQVLELAEEAGIDLTGFTIELERSDIKDELGRSYKPNFKIEF